MEYYSASQKSRKRSHLQQHGRTSFHVRSEGQTQKDKQCMTHSHVKSKTASKVALPGVGEEGKRGRTGQGVQSLSYTR